MKSRICRFGDQLEHIAKLYDPDDMTTKGISTTEGATERRTPLETHIQRASHKIWVPRKDAHTWKYLAIICIISTMPIMALYRFYVNDLENKSVPGKLLKRITPRIYKHA